MNRWIAITIITIVLIAIVVVDVSAQCPMCKIAAESNLENGGTEGAGLNRGILYMLSMPYIIALTLGVIWYRNRKKVDDNVDIGNKIPSAV